MVAPPAEWEFVLHTARLYERMGCDLLALDLVKCWEFLKPAPVQRMLVSPVGDKKLLIGGIDALGPGFDPRTLLRRRSSLVVADLPSHPHVRNLLQQAEGGVEESGSEEEDDSSLRNERVKEAPKKQAATQFREPDASSLLDSFGY
jgi:hypothetical protein